MFSFIFEDALEDGKCSSIVDLSQTVRQFVTEQRRSIVKAFVRSSVHAPAPQRGREATFADNLDRFERANRFQSEEGSESLRQWRRGGVEGEIQCGQLLLGRHFRRK